VTVYSWSSPYHRVAPEVAGPELERIRKKYGGFHRPRDVVNEARAEDNPLHPEVFQDTPEEAVERWREHRAQNMITSIKSVPHPGWNEPPMRVYVSIKQMEGPPAYTRTDIAMEDPPMRAHVLAQALREAEAFQRKFEHLTELAEIMSAVTVVVGKTKRKSAD